MEKGIVGFQLLREVFQNGSDFTEKLKVIRDMGDKYVDDGNRIRDILGILGDVIMQDIQDGYKLWEKAEAEYEKIYGEKFDEIEI